jgi:thymidylate kinase
MGKLIVYCGMDGSGKTTQAQRKFVLTTNSKLLHAHGYTVSSNSFGLGEETIKKVSLLLSLLLPLAHLDFLYTYYFKYKPILKTKNLICDRYFYDKVARLVYYGICPRWVAKKWVKIIPKPDEIYFQLEPIVKRVDNVYKWKGVYKLICDTLTSK